MSFGVSVGDSDLILFFALPRKRASCSGPIASARYTETRFPRDRGALGVASPQADSTNNRLRMPLTGGHSGAASLNVLLDVEPFNFQGDECFNFYSDFSLAWVLQ